MKILQSEKGIALVTSLMLTLISLTIVMALLYMITQGTKVSGQMKTYRTALDASYGGTEIFTKDILPYVLRNYSSTTLLTDVTTAFSGVNMQVLTTQSCLQNKLTQPPETGRPDAILHPLPSEIRISVSIFRGLVITILSYIPRLWIQRTGIRI